MNKKIKDTSLNEEFERLKRLYVSDTLDYNNAIQLAQLYADNEYLDEALDIYKSLTQPYPDDIPLLLAYGNCCFKKKNYTNALAIFKRITTIKPTRVEGWNNLGIVQSALEDYEGSRASFEKVLEIEVENHGALLNLGNYYMHAGAVDKAIELFERAISARHDFGDAWYNLGNAYLKKEQWEKALAHFEKALRYNPECYSAIKNCGFAYEKMQRLEKAEECYTTALKYADHDSALYCNLAFVLMRQSNYDKAKHYFLAAIRRSPREPIAWLGLRELSLAKGDIATYVKATVAVIHRLESAAVAETMRTLRSLQQNEHLATVCGAADRIKKRGDELDAERMLFCKSSQKSKGRADAIFKKLAAKQDPSDHLLLCLAEYCVAGADYESALQYVDRVNSKDRAYQKVLWNTLLGKRDLNVLEQRLAQYLQSNSDDFEAWYIRARAAALKSDKEHAEFSLKRALESGLTNLDIIESDDVLRTIYHSLEANAENG